MIPAMPEKTLLSIADALDSYYLGNSNIELLLKVAKVVTDKWTPQGQKKVLDQGWVDERGNLTYYRNLAPISGKLSLVVLCGVDRVTDSSGLSDFYTCDLGVIWQSQMGRSFKSWVNKKLQSLGHNVGPEDLKNFDRIFKPLLEYGRGDLLQISEWLENLDLSVGLELFEIQQIMLSRLDTFGLPSLVGFPLRQTRKSLAPYIDKAGAFFSYTLFLETRERDKAEKAIDKIIKEIEEGQPPGFLSVDDAIRGPYTNNDEFLIGLKNYILTDNKRDRQKLLSCDFVTILDKILKNRKTKIEKKKVTLRKVSGSPVEMALTALWQCMRDFFRDKDIPQDQHINSISIKYDFFKHDSDGTDDSTETARRYLSRLIGGLDHIVTKHLSLNNCDGDEIPIQCVMVDDDIPLKLSKTAEPQLAFSVYIYSGDIQEGFCRKFAWRLPENHSYRLAESLIDKANNALAIHHETRALPVFHLPYYDELLRASGDDEIRRVLLHCVRDEDRFDQKFSTNLLNDDWLMVGDKFVNKLKHLGDMYCRFIKISAEEGLLNGIFSDNGGRRSEWAELYSAYKEALDEASTDPKQTTAAMLLRSFLVISSRSIDKGSVWHADPFEQSGIITVLHPALLEMLQAQIVFLTSCFNYAVNRELKNDSHGKALEPHIWRTYTDLAEIQAPLSGLLHNEQKNLDTNVRGQGLIHRIGSASIGDATLSTRLLLNYDNGLDEDEDFSDVEMFRETNESKLLLRLMLDYFRLHPHARDGFSLAVFRNKDIQPVISAVHHYLNMLADPKKNRFYVLHPDRRRPYAISITFFTESTDDADVSSWLRQWQERWEASETETKYKPYRECRFAVAHRLVENSHDSFKGLINKHFEADIAVFYDFIGVGNGVNEFETVAPFDITTRTLQFPILEKACCTVRNPADFYKRARIISNRQFVLGAKHANLMHCLKNKSHQTGTVVVGTGDFNPWRSVIDVLHEKTEWVICIDPNMDERLLKKTIGSGKEREIIGFGSGVGTHGEDNYTISTEQFSLSDVDFRLYTSVQSLYAGTGWSAEECQKIATGVLKEARGLSGLSLVRATGVDDNYIHDFMAYALSRKMLRVDESVLCDNFISLDAYRHWFEMAENSRRPDLMWLTAKIGPENRLQIDIRLIECKLAKQSEQLLVNARSQINNGLNVLMPSFMPISAEQESNLEDERPDRRYWWMQLHRLIASKSEIDMTQNADVISALERLAEGDYDVSWSAAVFAFWTDCDSSNIQRIGQWTAGISNDVIASIYVMGSMFVNRLAIGANDFPIEWNKLVTQSDKVDGNVCDDMDDTEFPLGDDEDDDMTQWEDEGSMADEDENSDSSVLTDSGEENYSDDDIDVDADSAAEDSINTDKKENINDNLSETENPDTIKQTDSDGAIDQLKPDDLPGHSLNNQVEVSPSKIPERILLGNIVGSTNKIYWEFGHSDLANRHMLIFGSSGMGKTYAIQCLLCEMSEAHQNSLIVDYTNGFMPGHLEQVTNDILNPEQHVIRNTPLPINPFLPQSSDNGGIFLQENENSIAKRIAGIFNTVYQIGDQQFSVLHRAVMEGVEAQQSNMNFDVLLEILDQYSDDKKLKNAAQTLYSKIRPFVLDKPFAFGQDVFEWDALFGDIIKRCHVFQLTGLDMSSTKLVTEFVLWDLYGYLQSKGKKTDPKVIVLDEVQNLDHQEGSPLSKYLREGRKFGISLILATQTMSNMKKDERDRMFNADHKLFFKPADTELKAFAEIAAISTRQRTEDWIARLNNLKKGECYSIGPSLNASTGIVVKQAHRIKITSLEDRGFNAKKD